MLVMMILMEKYCSFYHFGSFDSDETLFDSIFSFGNCY